MRRGIFFGVIGTVLAFAGISLMRRPSVRAEVLTAPPAGRFEIIELHQSASRAWSGVLDTETGCVWAYSHNDGPDASVTGTEKTYIQVLGEDSFELVNFDPLNYIAPQIGPGAQAYGPEIREINRVQALCSNARVQAIEGAATH